MRTTICASFPTTSIWCRNNHLSQRNLLSPKPQSHQKIRSIPLTPSSTRLNMQTEMEQTESAKSLFHNANAAIKLPRTTLESVKNWVMRLRAARPIVVPRSQVRSRVHFLASTIRIFRTKTSTPSEATLPSRTRIITCQNSRWAPSHRCFLCKICQHPSTNSSNHSVQSLGREASGSLHRAVIQAIKNRREPQSPPSRTTWWTSRTSQAFWTITVPNQDLTAKIKILTRY